MARGYQRLIDEHGMLQWGRGGNAADGGLTPSGSANGGQLQWGRGGNAADGPNLKV